LFDAERSKFSTWLTGIARHQCVDALRHRRARPATEPADEFAGPDWGEDDPAEQATALIERERVRRALEQIPQEQRAVIYAAFFQGLTLHEIAERFGIPLGTVKTRLYRGMEKLRELLRGD
jgi:RNA polymerase sigma-70 factor (ECF subfamily)